MAPRNSILRPRDRDRGAVLIVALMFSLIIAISLVSFLNLSATASRLSYRTFYQGVAMNIAESGLEQALWEINKDSSYAWASPWDPVGTNAYRRSFTMDEVEGGAKTTVKVYAKSGSNAFVVARAIVTPPTGDPIEKWIKVTLTKKSRYSVGGLGRKGIVANGNQVEMASWNSDPDKDATTAFVPFSTAVMNDNVPLATLSLDASLNSGQADVNGTAAVGGDSTDAIQVGSNGYIGPFGTPNGVKDPGSISTNFSTDLDVQTAPATQNSLGAVTGNLTLPGGSDTIKDGVYYYHATEINLQNSTLSITPGYNVVIVVDGIGGVSVGGGSGSINIGGTLETNTDTNDTKYTAASLKIYTDGNVDIGGQGSANEVTVQNKTPASTIPTTTTTYSIISDVEPVYGKGKDKDTVIGWSYQQVTKTVVVKNGTTTTTTTTLSDPTTYKVLIASGTTTAPEEGEEKISEVFSDVSTPESITVLGTQPGQPNNFWLIGTRTDADLATKGPQVFTISGNGNLSAVVDAPNAKISAKGGGNSGFIYGSLIGYDLTFTGNDGFYYDESLANLDQNSKLGINDWDELVTMEDRTAKVSNASATTYADLFKDL
jgi:Tfp pilus assembly protein PilX